MVRPKAAKCGDCETCLTPKSKRACLRPPTAASAEEPCPLPSPLAKRQCTAPEKYEPSEKIRSKCQEDGRRWKPSAIAPSPSPPQQPRPMTSLQLWLNKPKIDQRVQELERQIGQIALGETGQKPAQARSRHSVRCCNRLPRSGTRSSVRAALQRQHHHASHEAARGQR